jgi:hypothetical protein
MEHTLEVIYDGYDVEKDRLIEKIVGKKSGASGYGFGCRDMAFYFSRSKKGKTTKDLANEALTKLKQSKIRGIKVKVLNFNDPE